MAFENRPLLSVRLITYNHEKYIGSAIEGALMQKTDFPVEIVVGDDCSTDRTPGIIEQYRAKYPEIIRVLDRGVNLGAKVNIIRTLRACAGKYIAHLDGDDYWTDPYKLQSQVEILETNPNIVSCFHNMEVRFDDPASPSVLYCGKTDRQVFTRMDLAVRNLVPASGNVFRNGLIPKHPDWFFQLPFGDWAWHLLMAQHGDFFYLPKIMGVYRRHEQGAWSSNNAEQGNTKIIQALDIMIENFRQDPEFHRRLVESREKYLKDAKNFALTTPSFRTRTIDFLIEMLKRLRG